MGSRFKSTNYFRYKHFPNRVTDRIEFIVIVVVVVRSSIKFPVTDVI